MELLGILIMGSVGWGLANAADDQRGREAELRRLRVELTDTAGLAEAATTRLRLEVEHIYASVRVEICWVDAGSPPELGLEADFARVYIMETLPASLTSRLRSFGGTSPMGLGLGVAKRRGGKEVSGATIYVSRRRVAEALMGAIADPAPEVLGRALGRVVAHELAHRFLQREHTRRGILKADLASGDLVDNGDWARFTKKEGERLRGVASSGDGRFRAP